MTRSLKEEIRITQRMARELGYDRKQIDNFVNAKSEIELENLLIKARRTSK